MPIDMSDLERRIAALEADRIRHLALINMLTTTAENLWSVLMQKGVIADPVQFAKDYLRMPTETRTFPGVDPSYIDVLSQDYEERTAEFRGRILTEALRLQQKKDRTGED
jgi:hypothetical protein